MPDEGEHRGGELQEAVAEQFGDGVDVAGLAGDHPARRVALVEAEAELAEVASTGGGGCRR